MVQGATLGGDKEDVILGSQRSGVAVEEIHFELLHFNENRAMGVAGEFYGTPDQVLVSTGSEGPPEWRSISIADTNFSIFPNVGDQE